MGEIEALLPSSTASVMVSVALRLKDTTEGKIRPVSGKALWWWRWADVGGIVASWTAAGRDAAAVGQVTHELSIFVVPPACTVGWSFLWGIYSPDGSRHHQIRW